MMIRGLSGRWPGQALSRLAVQVTVCAVLIPLMAAPWVALAALLFPPSLTFDIYLGWDVVTRLQGLFPEMGRAALAAGGGALLLSIGLKPLRAYAVMLVVFSATIAAVIAGDKASRRAMCETAAQVGVESFHRQTLFWSLGNAPREFQFDLHAGFTHNGQRYGWSYREMGWYVIPDTVWGEVDTDKPPARCTE